MSLLEARAMRKMPFLRRGMRVDMDGKGGRLTSGNSAYLRVRFDGMSFSKRVHPTWQMTFFAADGSIIKDYKEQNNANSNKP